MVSVAKIILSQQSNKINVFQLKFWLHSLYVGNVKEPTLTFQTNKHKNMKNNFLC